MADRSSTRVCRRCRLPQVISGEHDRRCTWHPRNRMPIVKTAQEFERDMAELDRLYQDCLEANRPKE